MKASKRSKAKPVVKSKSKAPPPKAVAAKKPVRIVKPAPKKKGSSEEPASNTKAAKRPAKPVKATAPKRERPMRAVKSAPSAAAEVQVAEELEVVSDVLEVEEPVLSEAEEAAFAEHIREREETPLISDISEIRGTRDDGDQSAALEEGIEPEAQEPAEAPATRTHLKRVLESLVFVAEQAITPLQLGRIVKAKQAEVREVLLEIAREYEGRGIELVEVSGGFQFRSAAASAPFVRDLVAHRPVRLTRAQLETLALIAYRQPITRPEIDDVRGVDSGSAIKVLLDRELVKILGRKDEAGRPLLYGTAPQFLDFFGMKTLQDLPTLREFTELSEENRELFQRKMGEVPDLSDPSNIPSAAPSNFSDAEDELNGGAPVPPAEDAVEPQASDADEEIAEADAESAEDLEPAPSASDDDTELPESDDEQVSDEDEEGDEDEDAEPDDRVSDVEDAHADDEDDDEQESDEDEDEDEDDDEEEQGSDEDEDEDPDADEDDEGEEEDDDDSAVEDAHDAEPGEDDDDSDEDADEDDADEDADEDADSDEDDDDSDIEDSADTEPDPDDSADEEEPGDADADEDEDEEPPGHT